jgi:hypothetical protein
MTILIVCWFLFGLPAMLWLSAMLGAHLYSAGHHGRPPGFSLPRFSVSKNGESVKEPEARLPRV